MAERHGVHGGVYKVAALTGTTVTVTRIAKTTSWTLTQNTELAEVRKHGANWVSRLKGHKDWNATVEMSLDMESALQTVLPNQAFKVTTPTLGTVLLALYVQDNSVGGAATIPRLQGTGWVQQVQFGSPGDDGQNMTVDVISNATLQFIT